MGISNRLGEKLPLSAELLIRRVTGDPHSAQWTIKATGLASLFYHGSKQSYLMSSYLLYYHEDILDSRRTHQQVVQQKFALRVKAGFNPFRDSAGCTIVTQWQGRLKSNSSEDQTLVLETLTRHGSRFLGAFCAGRGLTAIPNRNAYANEKEILLMWCTTIWRTTA